MKKNKMMRLASGLLVLTLLTTSIVSGTFAKYVTSGSSNDTARVAKWGVTVTASGETFANTYKTDDGTVATITNSVVSTDKVVAPGTKGTLTNITVSGKPEVAAHIEYKATLTLTGWEVTLDDGTTEKYCPIVFTVNDVKYLIGDSADDTENTKYSADMDKLKTAVEAAIKGCSKDFEANTTIDASNANAPTISWEWPFEVGTTDDDKVAIDKKDTDLGNSAANSNAATIKLEMTTTVTQID